MTEEEKQNKKFAYQLACLVKDSAYCEFCPVSEGCNLNFIRDDVECYVRFFNWFDNTNIICDRHQCQSQNGGVSMTKDERTVYVFALRYALPRHSYALSIVSQMILSRLDAFEDWELDGMVRDCWIYYPSLDCGGDIDRRKADEFKNKLLAELVRRGRDDLLSRIKDEAERREYGKA